MLRFIFLLSVAVAISLFACSSDHSLPVSPATKVAGALDSRSDREALKSFYNRLKDGLGESRIDFLDRGNWMSRSTLAKWEGVVVDGNGRVIELNLDGAELNRKWVKIGEDAFAALAELDRLQILNIPSLYLIIDPSDFSGLENIEHLDLHENFFLENGSYESLCGLANLRFLSNIPADESLLECVGSLSQLEHLKIVGNYFEFKGEWKHNWTRTDVCESCSRFRKGSFIDSLSPGPDSLLLSNLKNLENLKYLDLKNMGLRTVPSWIGELENLEVLKLINSRPFGGNPLIGPLPAEIGNLKNLKGLGVIASGPLPSEIGQMESLEAINIVGPYTNHLISDVYKGKYESYEIEDFPSLDGMLPAEWSNLRNLKSIYLKGYISGRLPAEWGKLDKLEVLRLEDLELTGSIPQKWGGMVELEGLYLHNNLISGSIPSELSNLKNLRRLSLHTNFLSGSIPEFRNLPRLQSLNLRGNELTGGIPRFVGLDSLRYLSLDENLLSGHIPSPFPMLPSIVGIDLSENEFTGPFPDFSRLTTLRFLKVLEGNDLDVPGQLPCRWLPPMLNYHHPEYQGNFRYCR